MIREISEKYSPLLAEIHRRCFADGWSEKSFRNILLQKCAIAFVEEDGAIIRGFGVANVVLDEAEIITFCILPEFRRQGLGKCLLLGLMNHLLDQGVGKTFLEVPENNLEAIRLYESVGFEKISRRPDYYRTKHEFQDALLMVLYLPVSTKSQ
ncbi:MAG: ribosomal protein S18-alanine N-acetyltransferase [Holosporaceae bacterium]|jgi:ribosomal-protein-alanine N-acetyltransferase|nr:ribosomal protein S18-alanine N-acetyltransferase [Holosporaceae bacterium]